MKQLLLTTVTLCLMLNTGVLQAQRSATVIRIVDGDTYQVFQKSRVYTVRLANVDAPETKQRFGEAAKDSVSHLLLGKTVLVDSIGKDRYGRVIAEITINRLALDSLMVSNGWAWYYADYSHKSELQNLQDMAISKRKGLWQCGTVRFCPPWVYRGLNNKNRAIFCSGCNN